MLPEASQSSKSFLIAFLSAAFLHGSLGAWAMMPEPPVALPQQQVINVAMISAPQVKPEHKKKKLIETPVPDTPPAKTGMKKLEKSEPKKSEKKKEEEPEKEKPVEQKLASIAPASGPQMANAKNKNAAITKPIAATYLKNPAPEYPDKARRSNIQGTVLLDVYVSRDGQPLTIRIKKSSGSSLLDNAAFKAVRQWKFVPAKRGSQNVEAGVVVPIQFKLG